MRHSSAAVILACAAGVILGAAQREPIPLAGGPQAPTTKLLLSCAVEQKATMTVTIDNQGHVTEAAAQDDDSEFVHAAVAIVLKELRPPVPPPEWCDAGGWFTEKVTVNCKPPGIGPRDPFAGRSGPPVRITGNIAQPHRWLDVEAIYPAVAREAHVQGVVILEFVVGTDGAVRSVKGVQDVRVLRSVPLLDDAAMFAARQWRYDPIRLNGNPIPFIMTAAVKFP